MMNYIIIINIIHTIMATYVNLKFNDNVIISLSTSSFLFKQSKLLQAIEIDEDNNIPILCSSTYIVGKYNHIFLDKKDLSFMVNLTVTKFLKICKFLDILCYENKDTLFSKQFIIYVMKNIKEQINIIKYFMRNEIRSIMNYINNECIDLQIKSCTLEFYQLYLTEYKGYVIKHNRIDIFELSYNKNDYYRYIHKYDNHLTYVVRETKEYNDYVIKITNILYTKSRYKNNCNAIKNLVEKGANVNLRYKYGNTILHNVVRYENNFEVIKFLVESGADVNLPNDIGETPLYYAVTFKNKELEVVKYLVEQGGNINIQNNGGETLLHVAVINNDIKVIKYLAEQGANVTLRNNYGKTAIDCASLGATIINYLKQFKH